MLKNVLSNWFGFVARGLISLALTPLLIRYLGDFNFGLWVLVISVVGYCGILDLGIRPTLHRYVARLKALNDERGLDETLASALAAAWSLGLLAALLVLACIPFAPAFFHVSGSSLVQFRWLLALLSIDVAIVFPARIFGAYLCGMQRFDLYNLGEVGSSIVRAILIVGALLAGWGILGVAGVTFLASILLLFLNRAMVRRVDPNRSHALRHASWVCVKEIGSYSFYLLLMTAGDFLCFYTDSVVIARVLTVALVTPYNVVSRLMEYFRAVIIGLAGPMVPKMSELDGLEKTHELRDMVLRGTRITALVSLFLGAMLILDGRPLLGLWLGRRFESSYPILLILVAGYILLLAQQPLTVFICAINRHQLLGWWTLVEGALNLVLSIHWAKEYGLEGVAFGYLVPMLLTGLIVQPLYALRLLRLSPLTYVTESLARPVAVAAVFCALCAVTLRPAGSVDYLTFGLIVAGQTALFAVLTFAFGFERSEREALSRQALNLARASVKWAAALEA